MTGGGGAGDNWQWVSKETGMQNKTGSEDLKMMQLLNQSHPANRPARSDSGLKGAF